jgi:hypothetical protein
MKHVRSIILITVTCKNDDKNILLSKSIARFILHIINLMCYFPTFFLWKKQQILSTLMCFFLIFPFNDNKNMYSSNHQFLLMYFYFVIAPSDIFCIFLVIHNEYYFRTSTDAWNNIFDVKKVLTCENFHKGVFLNWC